MRVMVMVKATRNSEAGILPGDPRAPEGFDTLEQALEWVQRCPDPMPGEESEIEIRPFYECEDFGDALTPEQRAKEHVLQERMAGLRG